MEYASKDRYNASQVPPEWHGWLHYITDHTGDEVSLYLSTELCWIFYWNADVRLLWCSCSCWSQRDMELNTNRTFLGREMNTSITPKGIVLTRVNETGQHTKPGNPRRFKSYFQRRAPMGARKVHLYHALIFLNKMCVLGNILSLHLKINPLFCFDLFSFKTTAFVL